MSNGNGAREQWDVVFSYTRAQAIEDGVLVDLSQGEFGQLCREAGFKVPVAMTGTCFAETVGHPPYPTGQSATGRLWDVLWLYRLAIGRVVRSGEKTDRAFFTVGVNDGPERGRRAVECYGVLGPGDHGEPVMTIMLIGED